MRVFLWKEPGLGDVSYGLSLGGQTLVHFIWLLKLRRTVSKSKLVYRNNMTSWNFRGRKWVVSLITVVFLCVCVITKIDVC